MKTYKAVIAAVATGLACTAVTSQAAFVPMSPGIGLTSIPNPAPSGSTDFNTPAPGDLLTTQTSNYSFGGNTGQLTTDVYKFNAADLPPLPITGGYVFIFTLTITGGSVNGLTVGGFSGPVAVNNVVGTASDAASANYDTLGKITFSWSAPQTSQTGPLKVVVDTSSTAWTGGISTVRASADSFGTATSLAPAPVPEPSTVVAGALLLLPFGIGAIRSFRKDRTV